MSHVRSTARRTRPAAVLAVSALVLVGALTGCEPARTEAKDKPVLLVHGWSASGGTDCGSTWGKTISTLKAQGFTGPFVRVGFYDGDKNCDMTLRSWGSFDNGSSWKDVSKALSKYISATYTTKGKTVDVVGYSMGGIIARGAVYGAAKKESGFSAPIKVEDAVTLGAPHNGAAWYSTFCLWGQCSTMKPGASDITWLNGDGNPQGDGGTEWSVVGSNGDEVTPTASALYMSVPAAQKTTYANVPHTGSGNYNDDATVLAHTGAALAKPGI